MKKKKTQIFLSVPQKPKQDAPDAHTLSNSTFYDGSELSHRSSTLPRRHRRHMSSESTFVISSRDCSPIRRRSPVYCSGSLPRSTHSIPAAATQSKVQRTIPNKHMINEQNRMTAKSGEIYRSPKKTGTLDNRLGSDRSYRVLNSGPSSYESGKVSLLSGPSSIESEKVSYRSGLSCNSYESPNRSIYLSGNCSPKFSPKHQLATKSKLAIDAATAASRMKSTATSTNGSTCNRSDEFPVLGKPPIGIPNSNSNSSITLQVTTSNESQIPNTKIFVQNSPVRSVITLENGKLLDNSNVYIINNETTTNGKGEIIKRSISKQSSVPKVTRLSSKRDKENELLLSETDFASETCDSLSFISETSPESSIMPTPTPEPLTSDSTENCKFTKNVNNDATMNNGRKFSLPISNATSQKNIVYNNMLKNIKDTSPTSPLNNKNVFTLDEMVIDKIELFNSERNTIAGSVGNLRFIEKNEKIINSNSDLKMTQYEQCGGNMTKLNSNPAINKESIAQILHKNMIAVGSEPNLAINSNGDCKQHKINNGDKSIEKEPVDRRFSISRENSINDRDEMYTFPSLSDLSFNFTSLAAQKILKGVSINSIDTLVELNMAQEKQQNNVPSNPTAQPQAICTDYGMV